VSSPHLQQAAGKFYHNNWAKNKIVNKPEDSASDGIKAVDLDDWFIGSMTE
jgi:hypothetical protein